MENKDPSTLQSDWMISSYTNLNSIIYFLVSVFIPSSFS